MIKGYRTFAGANAFVLHTYEPKDRDDVLDAMQAAGLKVVRIFLQAIGVGTYGAKNRAASDVEYPVGDYNEEQLLMVDELMVAASVRGIRLTISFHNRYNLGCKGRDSYWHLFKLPRADDGCKRIHLNDVSSWYNNSTAAKRFDERISYIINHRNALMGDRAWKDIPEAIFSFDIQNESQAYLPNGVARPSWVCERASKLRPQLSDRRILITTGGGADIDDSVLPEHFACDAIDVIALHSYKGNPWKQRLPCIVETAQRVGKRVIVQEFGVRVNKAAGLDKRIKPMQAVGMPWMMWEVAKPDKPTDYANLYELWTSDTKAWKVLAKRGVEALTMRAGAFDWPELFDQQPEGTAPGERPVPASPAVEEPVPAPPVAEQPWPAPPIMEQPVVTPPAVEQLVPAPPAVEQPVVTSPAVEQPVPAALALEQPVPAPLALEQPVPAALALEQPEPAPLALVQPVPPAPVMEQPVVAATVAEQPADALLQLHTPAAPAPHATTAAAKSFVFVRHGHSTWNEQGRIQGCTNESELTPLGRVQARRARGALQHLHFDSCFASCQTRARQTAELMWQGRQGPLQFLDSLCEADLGWFQGLTNAQLAASHPELYRVWRQAPEQFELDGRRPVADAFGRAGAAWRELLAAPGLVHLVVTHKSMMRALLCSALGLPPARFRSIDIANGSICLLRWSNAEGELRLSALNLTSHLYTDGIHYTLPAASKLDMLAEAGQAAEANGAASSEGSVDGCQS